MRDCTLSKEKRAELERIHRSLRDKRQADRVKAVITLAKGWSAAAIAEGLLLDEKTFRHYFERYQQGGSQALLDDTCLASTIITQFKKPLAGIPAIER
jgi:hypothetical protein